MHYFKARRQSQYEYTDSSQTTNRKKHIYGQEFKCHRKVGQRRLDITGGHDEENGFVWNHQWLLYQKGN